MCKGVELGIFVFEMKRRGTVKRIQVFHKHGTSLLVRVLYLNFEAVRQFCVV